jgi:hypothetical protein
VHPARSPPCHGQSLPHQPTTAAPKRRTILSTISLQEKPSALLSPGSPGQDHETSERSFRGLLDHLATLTRNTITFGDRTFDKISTPTEVQQRAFDLLGAPIPLTLE